MSSGQAGEEEKLSFETLVLHADGHNKPLKSHAQPIFQTSAFVFDTPDHGRQLFAGETAGHIYSRIGNPTVEAFEKLMCAMEQGSAAVAFSTGMAAILGSCLTILKSGDHAVIGDTMYGPSATLFTKRLSQLGITHTVVDSANAENVRKALKRNTKLIFVETPANPTCKITDIAAVSEIGHSIDAIVMVDSTFASPYNQQPLVLGADISLHSLTKYINGHGDVVGGCIVCQSPELANRIRGWRKDTGANLGPFDAWLVIRGIRTLPIRMARHNSNAQMVASFLRNHPAIEKVLYPGFADFENHHVMAKQMRPGVGDGYGATFSFLMKGGFEAAKTLLENLHLHTLAVSLGNTDSLIEHPSSMTHAGLSVEQLKQQGLTPSLVRISVGLEDPNELIADLRRGLSISDLSIQEIDYKDEFNQERMKFDKEKKRFQQEKEQFGRERQSYKQNDININSSRSGSYKQIDYNETDSDEQQFTSRSSYSSSSSQYSSSSSSQSAIEFNPRRKVYNNVSELVGNTPIVRLNKITEGCKGNICAKIEFFSPLQSVKDRIAVSMIEEAEKEGIIKRGVSTIVEATSGNTGIALAMAAATHGYKIILTMPETMSIERRTTMAALGAQVVITPGSKNISGAITKAEQLGTKDRHVYIPRQFENRVNIAIHERTTGPEIWEDTQGQIDYFVSGVGTGGTISGAGKYLKSKKPSIKIIAVEPSESSVLSGGKAGTHGIQGIGAGFVPKIFNEEIVDEIIPITTQKAIETARRLASQEGLFVGISAGAAVAASIDLAKRDQLEGKMIVCIIPDSGGRYLSNLYAEIDERVRNIPVTPSMDTELI
ncbi:MAG: Methionine gamma-lyase [Streblomastix strix]|uniref:Methionine gamma-lyase n=1 Tax=Streblomastix strix TaxID=222440 RepID=A0A5J4VWS6_9EUKA|nr:MAG: Methionine gamma-lyase [Streblomastix strix]